MIPPRIFTRLVRGWLREIEHGWCNHCHAAVPLRLMAVNGRYNPSWCKFCTAANTNRRYHEAPEVTKQWQMENRDKCREYARRWWLKNREAANEAAREYQRQKRREKFSARCCVCGAAFVHYGDRTTCSDACRLVKLAGRKATK